MEDRIQKDGVGVSEGLENDILKIMGGQNLEGTPHMKFFWEQQMKLLQAKKMGRIYYSQIIRFALSLHGNSAAPYREIRESGLWFCQRVLRDYKNYFKPKAGINLENIESLREKAATLTGIQRYLVLVMGEMKMQSNLVFDKYSGELIGFVDLKDPMTKLVRGMCSDLKHVIAYYFTENVTSYQIMSMFWNAVGVLELSSNPLGHCRSQ